MSYGRKYDFTRYDEYVAYFRALAEDHPAFFHSDTHKSFFQWHLEDLDRTLSDLNLAFPAMLIEEPESSFGDNGAGYVTDRIMGAVVVVDRVPVGSGAAVETEVKTRCKQLAMAVLAKMYHDKYQARIVGFSPNDTKGAFIGPVWDNVYGYRLEITLSENSTDAKLNTADFTESAVDEVLSYARMNGYAVTNTPLVYNTIFRLRRIA
ncbi:MAG: hypothetical protein C0424_10305 [Sphingobacteriaceae bacterium]|nr:hypothetical protein [Sphingobacteriaceae bacterium]